MRTFAVVGKNFGDEGKGLVTASLCMNSEHPLVVKHNGGAQAGHTVELGPDNLRFVHHQIGSGAEYGAATLFARTFLADLFQLGKELDEYEELFGNRPLIFAERETPVTIIDDVLINRALEASRGENRHGSCGMGIDECKQRMASGYVLTVGEIKDNSIAWIAERLMQIRREYTGIRVRELGLTDTCLGDFHDRQDHDELLQYLEDLSNKDLLLNYAEAVKINSEMVTVVEADADWLSTYDSVIFETGQGLLLDEDYICYAPHLTSSKTGMTNPLNFLKSRGMNLDEVIYVTRTYVTRHGAGPLPFECLREELPGVGIDATNIDNDWQGSIRYARHGDLQDFTRAYQADSKGSWADISLAVTHLDETKGKVYMQGMDRSIEDLENCAITLGVTRIYSFYGRTPDSSKVFIIS